MSIIVMIAHGGKVYGGADSLLLNPQSGSVDLVGEGFGKLFKIQLGSEHCLVGGVGDSAAVTLFQHSLEVPALPETTGSDAMMKWGMNKLSPAVHALMKTRGQIVSKDGPPRMNASFLIGVRGLILNFTSAFSVYTTSYNFAATGQGAGEVRATLEVIRTLQIEMPVQEQLQFALNSAEQWSAGVRRPFSFMDV